MVSVDILETLAKSKSVLLSLYVAGILVVLMITGKYPGVNPPLEPMYVKTNTGILWN